MAKRNSNHSIQMLKLFWFLVIALSIGTFYFWNLPQFVQGGDTGELVAAAFGLFVPHPPGYPLWIWLQHGFIQLFPVGSVFWRASLLGSLFSIGTLVLVALPFLRVTVSRKALLLGVFCLCLLGFSTVYLESALLPDVFSLHAMLVAAIGVIYLFARDSSKLFRFGVPFLFCLGISHHLTVVFLLPVVIESIFETIRYRKILINQDDPLGSGRKVDVAPGMGIVLGLLTTVLLYLSLLKFNTRSSFSWGEIQDLNSLWHHFLRSEYGTFNLAVGTSDRDWNGILFFFRSCGLELFGLSGAVVFALGARNGSPKKNWEGLFDLRLFTWGLTCLISIAFFAFANVTPEGMGAEVLRRFCVMPLVQITLLAIYLVIKSGEGHRGPIEGGDGVLDNRDGAQRPRGLLHFQPNGAVVTQVLKCWPNWSFGALALLGLGLNSVRVQDFVGLHEDSIFEDYATNLLAQAASRQPAIVLTENDNSYFGMRYVQAVLGKNPQVGIASTRLFFHKWYLHKIQTVLPTFRLLHEKGVWEDLKMDVSEDLIEPNARSLSLFVTHGFQDGHRFRTTYFPLGRQLSNGAGLVFNESMTEPVQIKIIYRERPFGPQDFSKRLLFADYSHFNLARGLDQYSHGKKEAALQDWALALSKVPYAFPALVNGCRLWKSSHEKMTFNSADLNSSPALVFQSESVCSDANLVKIREQAKDIFNF